MAFTIFSISGANPLSKMSIRHLATNTMIQSRMTTVSGFKKAFLTVTASLPGALQPVEDYDQSISAGVFGTLFQFFCDGSIDIQSGDRLEDTTTGDRYVVRAGGVIRRTYGAMDFLKVICEKV